MAIMASKGVLSGAPAEEPEGPDGFEAAAPGGGLVRSVKEAEERRSVTALVVEGMALEAWC